nr:9338_t:CDS:2 [Entrophospora candida]
MQSIKLYDYLKEKCPSLLGEEARYYPTFWIYNGHLQTAYAAFANFEDVHLIDYERKFVSTPDGGQIAVDWTPPLSEKVFDNTPTLVMLHGLTGGSHESYIRCLLEELTKPPHNYRAVVVNFRGCSESFVTSPKLYSAGATEDLRVALNYIKESIPGAPLMAVGFSLGANLLVKYLGEEGDKTPLIGAASVANPFDLLCGNRALERSYLGERVYSAAMADNLKKGYIRHLDVMKQDDRIHIESVLSSKTIREFDDRMTRISFGYDTVDDYYRDASSAQYVTRVKIPLLCLNAEDDPIVSAQSIPYDECKFNPYVILATTSFGGHLGWFEGFLNPYRWCIKPLSEYCVAIIETIEKS